MAVTTKELAGLEKRLVLHNWMNGLFGYGSTAELLRDLRESEEGFDSRGRSYVYERLYSRGDRLKVSPRDLERYDDNVRIHLEEINRNRAEPIVLKYFQHLAALYTEVFLDYRFEKPNLLLQELNRFAGSREDESIRFEENDLNKLAFWMATGSGKTLLMHLNYRQFLYYNDEPLDNILLITPNEGLTEQHLSEMRLSGIPCERFIGAQSGLGLEDPGMVRATEITKLTENKQGGGVSVDVEAFEGRNLIFVDEGHKGTVSSSTKTGKSWRSLRDRLDEQGFTFEYSATFGQALSKSGSDASELVEEYGRAILFDYSYRYFYEDGYGKDFQILNLKDQNDEYTDLLLLGNLLSFYQQRRRFSELGERAREYNLEAPLWIFVGSRVDAVYTEKKEQRSDVYTVVGFLHRFLKNEDDWSVRGIERLIGGNSGLEDGDGRDVFERKFACLNGSDTRDLYQSILRRVFHAEAGGALHVADIKGAGGELGLKVSGADEYFGLIYIGDTPRFKKLVEESAPEIVVEDDAIGGSLFEGINDSGSRINLLIGARKFIEGWSSWRVSNMGLMNVGQGEGPMIIQLFGRGVRLKGKDFSLKRSSVSGVNGSGDVRLLETLDMFGMKAGYMARFKEHLEREGVDPDGYEEMPALPIRRHEEFLNKGLLIPRPPEAEFAQNEQIVLDVNPDLKVSLDLSVRLETARMSDEGLDARAIRSSQEPKQIGSDYLSMLDWTSVYLDLLEFKNRRKLWNLIIPPEAPRRIMEQEEPVYSLVADSETVEPRTFAGLTRLQGIVQHVLQKYVERFYHLHQQRWDSRHMSLEPLTGKHPNFADYAVKVRRSERELVEEVKALIDRAEEIYDHDTRTLPAIHLDRHLYQPLLVEKNDLIKSTPAGLKESESNFVEALRRYCEARTGESALSEEAFLLRNLSRGKGVGFFDTAGFYPDFILWVKYEDSSQKVVFVEPHGMRNDNTPPNNDKVNLYLTLRDLSNHLSPIDGQEVFLDSYIISATPYSELSKKWGEGWTRERFASKHVLFEDSLDDGIPALLAPGDELERRISTSYPYPLASGFRSLSSAGDPRDLYREQLRFAENMLAFLASVSLPLLREEDRADMDLAQYWRGGISPGDWKEIIQRCSKVFAGYGDVPLARAIHGLNIRSEKRGFGRDVITLIREKNDYKHDRGPTSIEDISKASDEVQERLRRCMEALAFFSVHSMRKMKGSGINDSGEPRGGVFLELDGGNWIPLYPFIVPMTCPNCESEEVYFIDAWDQRKNTARLKSFERGHTMNNAEVSEALSEWINSTQPSRST